MMRKFFIVLLVFGHSCLANDDPLKNTEFKEVLKLFAEAGKNKYEGLPKPEGLTLKTPCTLCFDGSNSTKSNNRVLHRTTNFLIKVQGVFLGTKPKKSSKPLKNIEVGRVTLLENNENPGINGKFTLHYIGIQKKFQSKGFGSTALDLVILFAQQLASKSSFYDQLTLQCADYDGNKHLGDDPRRLTYYLNHGFHIDPVTLTYLPFLDIRHFVLSMSVHGFEEFLKRHDLSTNKDVDPHPLLSYLPQAEPVLHILQEQYRQTFPIQGDSLVEMAESNSSKAATRLLGRAPYASYLSKDEIDNSCEKVYLMRHNVKNWGAALHNRRNLLQERKKREVKTFQLNEENDFLHHITQSYLEHTSKPIAPTYSITTKMGDDVQEPSKMRKVGSTDETSPLEGALN